MATSRRRGTGQIEIDLPRSDPMYATLWSREWRKLNPEKAKKAQQRYRKETPLKYLYSLAKRRAKRKGQNFSISISDLGDIPKTCPLLGIKIDSYSEEQKYHPSIDRIDSNKGYIKGNVMIISHRANMLKNNADSDELFSIAINMQKMGV